MVIHVILERNPEFVFSFNQTVDLDKACYTQCIWGRLTDLPSSLLLDGGTSFVALQEGA